VGICNFDDRPSSLPLGSTDRLEEGGAKESGLELSGDTPLMRISVCCKVNVRRIRSHQSWGGPSDAEWVGDGVIAGGGLP